MKRDWRRPPQAPRRDGHAVSVSALRRIHDCPCPRRCRNPPCTDRLIAVRLRTDHLPPPHACASLQCPKTRRQTDLQGVRSPGEPLFDVVYVEQAKPVGRMRDGSWSLADTGSQTCAGYRTVSIAVPTVHLDDALVPGRVVVGVVDDALPATHPLSDCGEGSSVGAHPCAKQQRLPYECSAPVVLPHTTRFLCGSRLTRVMQRCAPPRALPAVRLYPLSPSRCSLSSAHDTDERERGLIDVEHFVLRVCAPGRPGGLARGPTREECTRHRHASSTRRRGRPRYVQAKSLPNAVLQRSDGGVIAPYAPLFPFRTHPGAGSSVRTDAVQHNHSSVMASKSRARRGSLSSPVSATSPKGTAPQVTPKLVDSSL